jgi:hypothetical protein
MNTGSGFRTLLICFYFFFSFFACFVLFVTFVSSFE